MNTGEVPDQTEIKELESELLGAPVVPPSRAAVWANALRRRVLGLHRRSAPAPLRVLETLFAAFDAHVLRALVELGVPDMLDGPMSVDALARATGTDAVKLDRLLRFAAARGFIGYSRTGSVAPTGVSNALRSDSRAQWRSWVRFATSEWLDAAWRKVVPALAPDARPPFELAHGVDFFEYTTSIEPSTGEDFDEAMAAGATLQAMHLARVLDWSDIHTVCDVGGGNGAALDALLLYEPHLETTLFDLPEVIDRARQRAGSHRLALGSFFDGVPDGHDRYLLLAIVHDWSDDEDAAILSNVTAAMGAGGEAVVVESIASERIRDDFAAASDILMFVSATGRERTQEQFEHLFDSAGLRIADQNLLVSGATAFTLRRNSG